MLDDIIVKRRSIRIYRNAIISKEDINSIITAGMWAPTACNKQDYRFIYLNHKNSVNKVSEMRSAHFLKNCNQAILVLYDNRIDNCEYHDDVLSAGMVIQNMLLKATDLGIGSCVIANLPSKGRLRNAFNIPDCYDPIALISLGYATKDPAIVTRKYEIDDIVFLNSYDKNKDQIKESFRIILFIKKILRKIYIRLPGNTILNKIGDKIQKKFIN